MNTTTGVLTSVVWLDPMYNAITVPSQAVLNAESENMGLGGAMTVVTGMFPQ